MRKLIYILFLLPFLGLAQELKVNEIKYQPIAQPSNPEEGDTYYDNTAQTLYFWNGVTWINTGAAGGGGGGDIGGSIDDNQIAVGSATANQIEGSGGLTYNGTTLSVSGKISVSDPGNSVFVGDLAGANDDATDNRNVGIGSGALGNITGGFYNTAIGYNAGGTLSDGITGVSSVNTGTYIGMETSPSATLGVANETVIGYNAVGNGTNTVTIGDNNVTNNYFTGNINATGQINGVDMSTVFKEGTNSITGVTWIGADAGRASLYIDPTINRIQLFQNVGNSLRMTPTGMTLEYYGGSGDQMLYVNNNGEVLTQAIPSGGGGSLTTDQTNRLANSGLPPKTLVKNDDFTLTADDMRMETLGNSDLGRSYIMTVNDGGTTVSTFGNVGSVDDVGRIKTMTNSDVFEAVPDAGVTLDWEEKAGSQNSIRVSGKGHLAYFQKTGANEYFFYGDITGFDNVTDAILAAAPIHYWTPESIQGGVSDGDAITGWNDTVGSLDGTVSGSVTLNLDGTEREVEFDGGYIDFADVASVDFDTGVDSFSIVVKTGTVTNTIGYLVTKHNGTTMQYGILNGSSNDLQGNVGGTGGAGLTFTHLGNDLFILNVNATDWDLWANGTNVDPNVSTGGGQAAGQSLNFGARTDGSFLFDGSLERVAIFDKELTPAEINAIELQFQEN